MAQIKWLSDIRSYHTAGVDSFQLYGGLDLVAFSITKALFVVMVILAGTPESLNLNCGKRMLRLRILALLIAATTCCRSTGRPRWSRPWRPAARGRIQGIGGLRRVHGPARRNQSCGHGEASQHRRCFILRLSGRTFIPRHRCWLQHSNFVVVET